MFIYFLCSFMLVYVTKEQKKEIKIYLFLSFFCNDIA